MIPGTMLTLPALSHNETDAIVQMTPLQAQLSGGHVQVARAGGQPSALVGLDFPAPPPVVASAAWAYSTTTVASGLQSLAVWPAPPATPRVVVTPASRSGYSPLLLRANFSLAFNTSLLGGVTNVMDCVLGVASLLPGGVWDAHTGTPGLFGNGVIFGDDLSTELPAFLGATLWAPQGTWLAVDPVAAGVGIMAGGAAAVDVSATCTVTFASGLAVTVAAHYPLVVTPACPSPMKDVLAGWSLAAIYAEGAESALDVSQPQVTACSRPGDTPLARAIALAAGAAAASGGAWGQPSMAEAAGNLSAALLGALPGDTCSLACDGSLGVEAALLPNAPPYYVCSANGSAWGIHSDWMQMQATFGNGTGDGDPGVRRLPVLEVSTAPPLSVVPGGASEDAGADDEFWTEWEKRELLGPVTSNTADDGPPPGANSDDVLQAPPTPSPVPSPMAASTTSTATAYASSTPTATATGPAPATAATSSSPRPSVAPSASATASPSPSTGAAPSVRPWTTLAMKAAAPPVCVARVALEARWLNASDPRPLILRASFAETEGFEPIPFEATVQAWLAASVSSGGSANGTVGGPFGANRQLGVPPTAITCKVFGTLLNDLPYASVASIGKRVLPSGMEWTQYVYVHPQGGNGSLRLSLAEYELWVRLASAALLTANCSVALPFGRQAVTTAVLPLLLLSTCVPISAQLLSWAAQAREDNYTAAAGLWTPPPDAGFCWRPDHSELIGAVAALSSHERQASLNAGGVSLAPNETFSRYLAAATAFAPVGTAPGDVCGVTCDGHPTGGSGPAKGAARNQSLGGSFFMCTGMLSTSIWASWAPAFVPTNASDIAASAADWVLNPSAVVNSGLADEAGALPLEQQPLATNWTTAYLRLFRRWWLLGRMATPVCGAHVSLNVTWSPPAVAPGARSYLPDALDGSGAIVPLMPADVPLSEALAAVATVTVGSAGSPLLALSCTLTATLADAASSNGSDAGATVGFMAPFASADGGADTSPRFGYSAAVHVPANGSVSLAGAQVLGVIPGLVRWTLECNATFSGPLSGFNRSVLASANTEALLVTSCGDGPDLRAGLPGSWLSADNASLYWETAASVGVSAASAVTCWRPPTSSLARLLRTRGLALPAPLNVSSSVPAAPLLVGDVCGYGCDTGSQLLRGLAAYQCMSSGAWRAVTPTPAPPPVAAGAVANSSLTWFAPAVGVLRQPGDRDPGPVSFLVASAMPMPPPVCLAAIPHVARVQASMCGQAVRLTWARADQLPWGHPAPAAAPLPLRAGREGCDGCYTTVMEDWTAAAAPATQPFARAQMDAIASVDEAPVSGYRVALAAVVSSAALMAAAPASYNSSWSSQLVYARVQVDGGAHLVLAGTLVYVAYVPAWTALATPANASGAGAATAANLTAAVSLQLDDGPSLLDTLATQARGMLRAAASALNLPAVGTLAVQVAALVLPVSSLPAATVGSAAYTLLPLTPTTPAAGAGADCAFAVLTNVTSAPTAVAVAVGWRGDAASAGGSGSTAAGSARPLVVSDSLPAGHFAVALPVPPADVEEVVVTCALSLFPDTSAANGAGAGNLLLLSPLNATFTASGLRAATFTLTAPFQRNNSRLSGPLDFAIRCAVISQPARNATSSAGAGGSDEAYLAAAVYLAAQPLVVTGVLLPTLWPFWADAVLHAPGGEEARSAWNSSYVSLGLGSVGIPSDNVTAATNGSGAASGYGAVGQQAPPAAVAQLAAAVQRVAQAPPAARHFELVVSGAANITIVGDTRQRLEGGPYFVPGSRVLVGGRDAIVHWVAADGSALHVTTPTYTELCGPGTVAGGGSSSAGGGGEVASADCGLQAVVVVPPQPLPAPLGRRSPAVSCPPFCPGLGGSTPPVATGNSTDVSLVLSGGVAAVSGGIFYVAKCVGDFTDPATGACADASNPASRHCAFGAGDSCSQCPPGALCPGGYRVRPLPGFWASSEASTAVVYCAAPSASRCLGWDADLQASRCGRGYRAGSYACSVCAPGYYPSWDGKCSTCPRLDTPMAQAVPILTFVGGILGAGLVMFGVVVLVTRRVGGTLRGGAERTLQFIVWVFMAIQSLVQVNKRRQPWLAAASAHVDRLSERVPVRGRHAAPCVP
jgi:hypothetical protein